jgi:serine protease AprX
LFVPNYPTEDNQPRTVLSLSERTGALLDYTGKGVVIAFIDSGFYPHPDLGDRVLIHVDATTNRVTEGRRFFQQGSGYSWHGQMTSVIAAGNGRTSGGKYRGIASNAQMVLVKVSNLRNRIKEPDILRGLEWLVANHARFNVRIVNISVGGDDESHDPEHPLHKAVKSLVEAGVTITIAAGNTGAPILVPPASAPEALTIGGVDDRNTLDRTKWQPFPNNYSAAYDGTLKPEVIGPAAWIPSPMLPNTQEARETRWLAQMLDAPDQIAVRQLLIAAYSELNIPRWQAFYPDEQTFESLQARIFKHKVIDAHHQHVEGTSVSSAIVASIIAQMLEANPQLTPKDVRSILMQTARPLPDVSAERQGAGVVDACAAVNAATAAESKTQSKVL